MSISNPTNSHIRSEKLHPDVDMANWFIKYLPSKEEYWNTATDYIIRSKNDCLMLVELKKHNAKMKACQKNSLAIIDQALTKFNGNIAIIPNFGTIKVKYMGFHLLEIDGPRPDQCKTIKWDRELIDQRNLISNLMFVEN